MSLRSSNTQPFETRVKGDRLQPRIEPVTEDLQHTRGNSEGFDSRSEPNACDIYTGWLRTRRAQVHFAVSLTVEFSVRHNLTSFNLKPIQKKSNLHYTGDLTQNSVTIGGIHLRGLVSMQHNSEKTFGDERLAIWSASESNPRPASRTAICFTTGREHPHRPVIFHLGFNWNTWVWRHGMGRKKALQWWQLLTEMCLIYKQLNKNVFPIVARVFMHVSRYLM